jgi:multiple antibiotic resistance protein
MQAAAEVVPQLGLAAIFTLLFVTLGPIKLLAPFAQATREMDAGLLKRIALLTFLVGTGAVLFGGLLGKSLLASWQISIPAITLAGGVILFLVGLRMVLEPYSAVAHESSSLPAKPLMAACHLAFPLVVTPYGLAAVIALLANSAEPARAAEIVAILVAVMVMNLLSMLYIRHIMGTVTLMTLQIFGAMLAVLQLALSVQIMLRALRLLGLIQ